MRPDNHVFAGLVTLYADTGNVGLASQWLQAKVRVRAPTPASIAAAL